MSNNGSIASQDILSQLHRILKSGEFSRSPVNSRFLSYLVTESLEGRSDRLKEYTIGIEVFDKDEDFDTGVDTNVRVSAGRLRKMLERYYLKGGKDDPVIFSIPKGGYEPEFQKKKLDPAPKGFSVSPAWLALGAAILVMLAVGFTWAVLKRPVDESVADNMKSPGFLRRASELPTGPSIAVLPFKSLSRVGMSPAFSSGLAHQVIAHLSRFKDLFVIAADTTMGRGYASLSVLETARGLNVDYVLVGSVSKEKKLVNVTARLLETSTGRVAWSKLFRKSQTGLNLFEIQSKISSSVASALGQPYGIINRLESRHAARSTDISLTVYGCYLRFFEYAQQEDARTHQEVRGCLENAVVDAPDFAPAWAALSGMYVDEYRQGFNIKIGDEPPLDRALVAARKAVQLDPDDAFSHQRFAGVLISMGDVELAREEIVRALELNPNSAEVVADVGWIIKNLGEWVRAYMFAAKAIALNPGHPPWYLETSFLFYYLNQDCKNAKRTANAHYRKNGNELLSHIFRTVASVLCGEKKSANASAKILKSAYPGLMRRPRKTLKNLTIPDDIIPLMIPDLEDAGLVFKK